MNKNSSTDQSFLDALYKVIEEHLVNEQFGVEELAREMAVSRSQLHRRVHTITGHSTSQLIREYRLKKAKALLENESATVAEVSYQVGFGSPSYFNTCFHEYFGYPPGEVKIRRSIEQQRIPFITKKNILISASILVVLLIGYFSLIRPKNSIAEDYKPLVFEQEIAVLPPVYLDEDTTNQYLANGVFETITGHLSKIEDLRVTPTNTVEQYRGTTKTAQVIGAELGVGSLVKWSFSMIEDQVKLFIQLIDTENEDQIFSKEYKRNYNDIYALQSEVAQTIAAEIEVGISPKVKKRIESAPTKNMDAYKLCMQGQHYSRLGPSGRIKAIEYYEQAMALDPDYALSWLYYGWTKFGMRNSDILEKSYGDSALFHTRKAIELDPDLDIAYYRLGMYYNGISDSENAIYYFEKTLELNPNQAMVHLRLGWVYGRMGRFKDRIISLEKGKKLAVGSPNTFAYLSFNLGEAYNWIGYHAKAEEALREVLNIQPINAYSELGDLSMGRGDWDMMKLYTDKVCAIDSGETCLRMLYKYYLHTEDFSKALKYADLHIETGRELDIFRMWDQAEYGYILSQLHRKEEARTYYDKQIYFCKENLRLKRVWAMEGVADVALFGTYIYIGDHEMAIHHLKEYEKKFFGRTDPTYFQVAPQYKPIWENEEFKVIMQRQQKKYADIRAEIDQLEKDGKL